MRNYLKTKKGGFSLVELIVSIGLFITVSLIAIGALLSVVGVNKKTQTAKSVFNNLSFAVESMSKAMRVGVNYHCENVVEGTVPPNLDTPRDCSSGGNLIAFESSKGDTNDPNDQIVYRLLGNQIERSVDGGGTFVGVTAPEVEISSSTGLRFYVFGSSPSDNLQPRVLIIAKGRANLGNQVTDFNIQTLVSQRDVDG